MSRASKHQDKPLGNKQEIKRDKENSQEAKERKLLHLILALALSSRENLHIIHGFIHSWKFLPVNRDPGRGTSPYTMSN